ncbi:PBSX family phage terminase large subunit [Turicibacter sanguinis]|uniref:PBSX family phage terminase large subunit n=2 Tax=Turicibacter sanguinis TaxID=154288 RepID=A0A6G2CD67_9FIRM|nr:PBSX family phage terminase large subunit [Turicibacter sanguinis]MTK70480.1 PBSX family phage terminase large subunit [Turicibacter sanguinis]MTK73792.1 PBSX family phage terminase large subunit [Turicibacter sanguinis]MTK81337.1 PBSX family phage terminase large subunit [Turicibacter sanguinis]MTK83636.1 PBSX family phage terminase large subunit [Turicibacter sanguinis]
MMTMQINLQISKKIFSPHFYPYLFDYSHRWNIFMGGAGSGKSHFVIQKLIIKACQSKRKVCMCRRYGTTINNSIWDLTKQMLRQLKLLDQCSVNKSERSITLPNGSMIIMLGLDDEEKLLSINGVTDFFIEEIFEVPQEIVDQIDLRLRAKAPYLQIYGCFNPISPHHWLHGFCEGDKQPADLFYDRSNYKDNPFLPQSYVDSLESLKTRNPNKYRIFAEGNWGTDLDGLVFKHINFINSHDIDVNAMLKDKSWQVRCGMDIGELDPTAIAVSLFNERTQALYLIKEFYQRGATLDEMYEAIINLGIQKQKIYVDSASPQVISYLKSKGINAQPCIKGAGSVEARISYLQNLDIYVLVDSCPNAQIEFENFVYLKDKKTNVYTNKTDHTYSHLCCDALGYSICDIYSSNRVKIFDKSSLRL